MQYIYVHILKYTCVCVCACVYAYMYVLVCACMYSVHPDARSAPRGFASLASNNIYRRVWS